ncbi:potassium-transporting ATPase subunit C [Yinghuangia sp. ASG 101]|uniref:potassium-transporting ATPase subunit C n=1 Tax=Yinghuangia sp. ASG 101 TaxID=2896848 RepID=UPI001E596584|nr:potassium-transporting ATPase subunit C [Yinghuangia sp. ASG 101]UGQ13457.1 potassium-transporting ATPase subunit C [Yinghuangia sp. ASG 101]
MASPTSTRIRVFLAGLRALLVLTVILGVAYPLTMTGLAQAAFGDRANGSRVEVDGREVGSSLIGQNFDLLGDDGVPRLFDAQGREVVAREAGDGTTAYTYLDGGTPLPDEQADGVATRPDPAWFQPRPSAGAYDPLASGASNFGPENPEFIGLVKDRKAAVAAFNGVPEDRVPADAVTASGSGLDPHISEAYALIQVNRVAGARGLDPAAVRSLVADHVEGRVMGFLGDERVNVLELNIALTRQAKA